MRTYKDEHVADERAIIAHGQAAQNAYEVELEIAIPVRVERYLVLI